MELDGCCYSKDELLALRPSSRSIENVLGLTLGDVPPDQQYQDRRSGQRRAAIGPITECVPVDAEVLKSKRGELRQIERETGAQIKEKAGLRGYTVMITGTKAIVEQALHLVEQALQLDEPPQEAKAVTEPLQSEGERESWEHWRSNASGPPTCEDLPEAKAPPIFRPPPGFSPGLAPQEIPDHLQDVAPPPLEPAGPSVPSKVPPGFSPPSRQPEPEDSSTVVGSTGMGTLHQDPSLEDDGFWDEPASSVFVHTSDSTGLQPELHSEQGFWRDEDKSILGASLPGSFQEGGSCGSFAKSALSKADGPEEASSGVALPGRWRRGQPKADAGSEAPSVAPRKPPPPPPKAPASAAKSKVDTALTVSFTDEMEDTDIVASAVAQPAATAKRAAIPPCPVDLAPPPPPEPTRRELPPSPTDAAPAPPEEPLDHREAAAVDVSDNDGGVISANDDAAVDDGSKPGDPATKSKKAKKKKAKKQKSEEASKPEVPQAVPQAVPQTSSKPNISKALTNLYSKTKFSGLTGDSDSDEELEAAGTNAKTLTKETVTKQTGKKQTKTVQAKPSATQQSPAAKAKVSTSEPPPGPNVPAAKPPPPPPPKQPETAAVKQTASAKVPLEAPATKTISAAKPKQTSPSPWASPWADVPETIVVKAVPESSAPKAGAAVTGTSQPPPGVAVKAPPATAPKAGADLAETRSRVAESSKAPAPQVHSAAARQPAPKSVNPLPQRTSPAMPAPKATNPLPQKATPATAVRAAHVNTTVSSSVKRYAGNANLSWMDKPVERISSGAYYEEEDDPELQKYLWNRNTQQPRQRAAPPVQVKASGRVAAVQKAAPQAPPPHRQRALLSQVMDMGFDEQNAKRALASSGWAGVEQAVAVLLG
eukprot:TRINITY_DN20188_c0_g1_i1.p1 TRINITY_DN20188_c0_g1~~TRINITY_DN20188_c0_g1_i1.p1  ORF type:complete len:879 (-),score=199.82 TRINITY_DN20188_c0_g1_i1:55-2691(-)